MVRSVATLIVLKNVKGWQHQQKQISINPTIEKQFLTYKLDLTVTGIILPSLKKTGLF